MSAAPFAEPVTLTSRECWLYAFQIDEDTTVIYRTTLINDDHQWVREVVGDAEPVHRSVVTDSEMVFGSAEFAVYRT